MNNFFSKEILNNAADTDNRHIREERGLQALQEDNEDEEFHYSSVYSNFDWGV